MDKLPIIEKLNFIVNDLLISVVAALIRVIFSPGAKFVDTLLMFAGGILSGTLFAYVAGTIGMLKNFETLIAIVFGIIGKEVTQFLIKDSISLFKQWVTAFINRKTKSDANTSNDAV